MLLVVAVMVGLVGCGGSGSDQVEFQAVLNDVDVASTSPRAPAKLADDESAELELTITNVGTDPVEVNYVLFEGKVIDTIFLTYDTAIRVPIAPGETEALPPIVLDFYDLGGQASGYLRGQIELFDGDRRSLGAQEMFFDADGSGWSTLGLFNVLLLIATAAGIAWNLWRLAQRRLPGNRGVRALRFLAIGVGVALTLSVAFSTLRIWPLDTLAWVLFLAVGAIIGYAIGFVLTGADDEIVDLLDEQDVLDAVVDSASQARETVVD